LKGKWLQVGSSAGGGGNVSRRLTIVYVFSGAEFESVPTVYEESVKQFYRNMCQRDGGQ